MAAANKKGNDILHSVYQSVRTLSNKCLVLSLLALAGCQSATIGVKQVYRIGDLNGLGAEISAIERGKEHFYAGRLGLSVKSFRLAAAINPTSVRALNGLAASYDQLGRFDLSQRYYRRALAMDPQSVQTLNNLGYSNYLQGRFDLAIGYLSAASDPGEEKAVVAKNRQLALAGRASAPTAADDADKSSQKFLVSLRQAVDAPDSRPVVRIERTTQATQSLITKPTDAPDSLGPALPWRRAVRAIPTNYRRPARFLLAVDNRRLHRVSNRRRGRRVGIVVLDRAITTSSRPMRGRLILASARSDDRIVARADPMTITDEFRRNTSSSAKFGVEFNSEVIAFGDGISE